jgi:hypothetical protein
MQCHQFVLGTTLIFFFLVLAGGETYSRVAAGLPIAPFWSLVDESLAGRMAISMEWPTRIIVASCWLIGGLCCFVMSSRFGGISVLDVAARRTLLRVMNHS